jgi:hypothetical protein
LDTSFGAAVLKARKVFTGSRAFYRQFACFVSFQRKPLSQKAAFKTACKANRLSNQHASIPIRLSGLLNAFAFAVNFLPLCQLTVILQYK